MKINLKELLNADYNLKSWLDILYAENERDWDKIIDIERLLNIIRNGNITQKDWAEIQEYVIAREIIRDKSCNK